APAAAHGVGVEARGPRGAGRTGDLRPAPAGDRGRALALPALRPPAGLVREHPGAELAGAAWPLPQLQGADLDPVSAGGTAHRGAVPGVRVAFRVRLAGLRRLPAHLLPDRAVGHRPAHPAAARLADPAVDVARPG